MLLMLAHTSKLNLNNPVISQQLHLLNTAQVTGDQLPTALGPQDVHSTAYASAIIPPLGLSGALLLLAGSSAGQPMFRTDSHGPPGNSSLPLPGHHNLPSGCSSPGPFRGSSPLPIIFHPRCPWHL